MRSLLLSLIAAVAIPACTQDITGGGPGGGDDQQPTCGNGVVDQGEACDDNNTNNGDGCSSTCQTENTATPRVAISVDKPTLPAMDLNTGAQVTITLTSMMGFAGDVALTTSVVDVSNQPITDWTTTLDSSTVTVAADGTATAHITINAMGDTAALSGTVKVTATSGSLTADASVGTTFNPVLDVVFTNNGTDCVYPVDHTVQNPWNIKMGRKIAVYNGGNGLGFIIHANNQDGFNHETQATPGTLPGQAYMSNAMTGTAGDEDTFYCHPMTGVLAEPAALVAQRNYYKLVQ